MDYKSINADLASKLNEVKSELNLLKLEFNARCSEMQEKDHQIGVLKREVFRRDERLASLTNSIREVIVENTGRYQRLLSEIGFNVSVARSAQLAVQSSSMSIARPSTTSTTPKKTSTADLQEEKENDSSLTEPVCFVQTRRGGSGHHRKYQEFDRQEPEVEQAAKEREPMVLPPSHPDALPNILEDISGELQAQNSIARQSTNSTNTSTENESTTNQSVNLNLLSESTFAPNAVSDPTCSSTPLANKTTGISNRRTLRAHHVLNEISGESSRRQSSRRSTRQSSLEADSEINLSFKRKRSKTNSTSSASSSSVDSILTAEPKKKSRKKNPAPPPVEKKVRPKRATTPTNLREPTLREKMRQKR